MAKTLINPNDPSQSGCFRVCHSDAGRLHLTDLQFGPSAIPLAASDPLVAPSKRCNSLGSMQALSLRGQHVHTAQYSTASRVAAPSNLKHPHSTSRPANQCCLGEVLLFFPMQSCNTPYCRLNRIGLCLQWYLCNSRLHVHS